MTSKSITDGKTKHTTTDSFCSLSKHPVCWGGQHLAKIRQSPKKIKYNYITYVKSIYLASIKFCDFGMF